MIDWRRKKQGMKEKVSFTCDTGTLSSLSSEPVSAFAGDPELVGDRPGGALPGGIIGGIC